MSRHFTFSINEYYHSFSRGTEKRNIFIDKKDYERFIALLFICNSVKVIHLSDYPKIKFNEVFNIKRDNSLVEIGSYCLMPNHFHLLLREKQENGISLFMQKLITGYTMYFNKKNNRTGSLFESRFKAEYLNNDKYLKYIFSYIHLNPVKLIEPQWKKIGITDFKKVEKFLYNYNYSSYLDYLENTRPQKNIINKSAFPLYFKNKKEFLKEIYQWLTFVKVQP
jgi:putative transposase